MESLETSDVSESPQGAAEGTPWQYVPKAPTTVEETGIPDSFLSELVLKAIWVYDTPTTATLIEALGLNGNIIGELVQGLKREGLCEVRTGEAATAGQFRYRPTEKGKVAAEEALNRCRYVGAVPVSVSAYNEVIAGQIERFTRPTLDDVRQSLEHLVLSDDLVKRIGQAFFSRRALMIYGPSGNGKTEIVTSIAKIISGTVVIPYALYGHGQLIKVFDPDVHISQVDDDQPSDDIMIDEATRRDRRWLPVNRPTVMVGGTMGEEALEMTYDPLQGVHNAPLSVVSQGGVLIIDDLGRQKVSPKEILNRWVTMMEQGYDSFALSTSEIVRLPLDVTLIFSTNLTVQDLMDEAYLRRIAYKIEIPNLTRDQLSEVTRRFCDKNSIPWTPEAVDFLMERLFEDGHTAPRGCYPRDIITTIKDSAEFEGHEPVLDEESVRNACDLYFGTHNSDETAAA